MIGVDILDVILYYKKVSSSYSLQVMELENLRKAYICAFQLEGVPRRLAEDCADILINDRVRDRTPAEQETINKAWQIANGIEDEGDIAA